MAQEINTDLDVFMADCNAGILKAYVETMLSEVALAVTTHDAKGQLQVTFNLEKMKGNLDQVMVTHEMKYKKPKARGAITESDKEQTPFFVGKGGRLTLLPPDHGQMYTKAGEFNVTGDPEA
jgi:hypothetical protein